MSDTCTPVPVCMPSLMRYFIASGNAPCIETLINRGFDLNTFDATGTTPLHIAAVHGNVDIMELLVSHGARPDVADACGRTPLDIALFVAQPVAAAWLRDICLLADAVDGMLLLSMMSHKLV